MQTKLIEIDIETTITTASKKSAQFNSPDENTSFKTKRIKTVTGSPGNFVKSTSKPENSVDEHNKILKDSERYKKENDMLEQEISYELLRTDQNNTKDRSEPLSESLLEIAKRNTDCNALINEFKPPDEKNHLNSKKAPRRRNSDSTYKLQTKTISKKSHQTQNLDSSHEIQKPIMRTRRATVSKLLTSEPIQKQPKQEKTLSPTKSEPIMKPKKTKQNKDPQLPKTGAKKAKLTQSTLSFTTQVPVKSISSTAGNGNATGLNTFACLRNLGSTCYINCIIQVMRYTPGFVESIHRLNKQIDYLENLNAELETEISSNNNAKFVKNLHQLLVEMSEKEKQDRRPIYSPVKFVKTVWTLLSFWSNGSQQDAHEFLQYTIHFINECDIFIRKLQQQYQLKPNQMQTENCDSTTALNAPRKKTTPQVSKAFIPSTPRMTKNSLKTASMVETAGPPLCETSKDPISHGEVKPVEIFAEITMEVTESMNKNNCEVKRESSHDEPNSVHIVINQQLSERLIKSMPQLPKSIKTSSSSTKITMHQTNGADNFLRTPTKGGASAYNSTSSMNSTSKTQYTSKTKLEPVISPPLAPTQSASLLNKHQSSPVKTSELREAAEEMYSFDEDSSENYDVFKAKKAKTTSKSFDFNLKCIYAENNGPMSVDERDLVSKRLKETLLKNEQYTKNIPNVTGRRSVPSTDFEYKQHYNKKIKRENNIKNSDSLNDSLNSIIIIDSDNDEDVEIFPSIEQEPSNLVSSQNELKPVKKQFKAAPKSPMKNVQVSSIKCHRFSIVIEDINLKTITESNKGLIISDYVKDMLHKEYKRVEKPIQPIMKVPAVQVVVEKPVKKLRSKSKTFPVPLVPAANIVPNADLNGTVSNRHHIDLNEITVINPVFKPVNVMNNNGIFSTNPITNFRSKLRSTASTQRPVDNAPSLSICSVLPPSPAELLRKYSTSSGYTCEMDKLFKGSSVTVTQCLECENLRKCPEAFYDRSIPIDTNDELVDEDQTDWISKCLNNESYLNENSKYMCDKCQSKQEAKIHTQYTQMPNILILHLLSYGITSSIDGNLNAQKLSNRSRLVNYFNYTSTREALVGKTMHKDQHDWMRSPITSKIKMNQSISNNNHFKLFAVVMHSGTTLNSGHYTAFINYKIISQSCSSYSNDFSSILGSHNGSFANQRSDSRSCSCFIDTKKKLNTNSVSKASDHPSAAKSLTSQQDNSNSDLDSQWLHFDDTKVKLLNNLDFQRKIVDSSFDSPYILFYVRE